MSKELFIVILIFSILILTVAITLYLYNYRINKRVKAYINDKNIKRGLRIPSLTYVLGVVALAGLILSSAIYIIPRQKLYEVEYVLYKHPESMTIVIGEEADNFDLERLVETIKFTAKDLSGSDKCEVFLNSGNAMITITRELDKIVSINLPNIVIAYNSDAINNAGLKSSGSWYDTDYQEYKEYTLSYNNETGKITLKATMYSGENDTFFWGPLDSSLYSIVADDLYEDFELQYEEFLLGENTEFVYDLIITKEK